MTIKKGVRILSRAPFFLPNADRVAAVAGVAGVQRDAAMRHGVSRLIAQSDLLALGLIELLDGVFGCAP